MHSGRVGGFTEYWQLIEAILTSAYLYNVARLQQESRRPTKKSASTTTINLANVASSSGPTSTALLREYVSKYAKPCKCGGQNMYAASELPAAQESEVVLIPIVCKTCDKKSQLKATLGEMEQHFDLKPSCRPRPR
jgi:hypothetical protein